MPDLSNNQQSIVTWEKRTGKLGVTQVFVKFLIDDLFKDGFNITELPSSDFLEYIDFGGDDNERELLSLLELFYKNPNMFGFRTSNCGVTKKPEEVPMGKTTRCVNFRMFETVTTTAIYHVWCISMDLTIVGPNDEEHHFRIQCLNNTLENCKLVPPDPSQLMHRTSHTECCNIL